MPSKTNPQSDESSAVEEIQQKGNQRQPDDTNNCVSANSMNWYANNLLLAMKGKVKSFPY